MASTSGGVCHKCKKSESDLPGKLKQCAKCQSTKYCSRKCQTGDWKSHKVFCSRNLPGSMNPSDPAAMFAALQARPDIPLVKFPEDQTDTIRSQQRQAKLEAVESQSKQQTLNLDLLRDQLIDIDESNITDLLALKKTLDSALGFDTKTTLPTIPASKLTRTQIFSNFNLKNVHDKSQGGFMDFGPFMRPTEYEGGPREWLAQTMNRCAEVLCQQKETYLHPFLHIIMMDVVHDLPGTRPCTTFTADGGQDTSAPPAQASNPKLLTFNDIRLYATITLDNKPTRVVSRFDIVITTSPMTAGPDPAFLDPFLAIFEVKGVDDDFDTARHEAIVSLAILYHARARRGKHCPSYAVVTNGLYYEFLLIDDRLKICHTMTFDCVRWMSEMLQYYRYCFAKISGA